MQAQEKAKEWESVLVVSALAVEEWGAKEAAAKASETESETESAPANYKRTRVQPYRMRPSMMPNHGPMALHCSQAELENH